MVFVIQSTVSETIRYSECRTHTLDDITRQILEMRYVKFELK